MVGENRELSEELEQSRENESRLRNELSLLRVRQPLASAALAASDQMIQTEDTEPCRT